MGPAAQVAPCLNDRSSYVTEVKVGIEVQRSWAAEPMADVYWALKVGR